MLESIEASDEFFAIEGVEVVSGVADVVGELVDERLADARGADTLVHLAVWREEPAPSGSPVSAPVRQKLVDFFSSLERSAGEAEAAFRGRVAAILGSSTMDVTDVVDASSPVPPRAISSVVTQENPS